MTKIVFITQDFDPEHLLLAAVVPQATALARQVDEFVVIADTVDESALPPNARARTFRSRTKLGRGLRLLYAVARELPGLRRDGAVVAHMCPVYANVVAPLVRPAGVPLVLWWCHSKMNGVTRLAEKLCTRVVSVDASTFPMASKKLITIGHATDVASIPLRAPHVRAPGSPLRVLVLGRYGGVKGVSTIVRAAGVARDRGLDLRVEVHGPAPTGEARAEREALRQLVAELDLGDTVLLGDAVSRGEVMNLFASADVLVSNTHGGADRVVFEAAASGLPALASNRVHADVLDPESFFGSDDPEELATKLSAIAALTPPELAATGARLRERVVLGHSVDSWAAGVLRAAGLLAAAPVPPAETAASAFRTVS